MEHVFPRFKKTGSFVDEEEDFFLRVTEMWDQINASSYVFQIFSKVHTYIFIYLFIYVRPHFCFAWLK